MPKVHKKSSSNIVGKTVWQVIKISRQNEFRHPFVPMEKFSPLLKLKVNNFSLAKSTTSAFSFSCLMRKTQKFSPSKHDKRKSQQQARATCRMKTILQQQQQQRPELDCFDNMAKVFRTCDACVDGAFAFYFFFPPFSFFFLTPPRQLRFRCTCISGIDLVDSSPPASGAP